MSKSKKDTDNNMILVESGRFEMSNDSKRHLITITKDFYICKFPVTFAEYDEFCNLEDKGRDKPADEGFGRDNRPVINVTWYDAIEYCNWKSRIDGFEEVYKIYKSENDINNKSEIDDKKWTIICDFDKKGYRLPTEAEWEFAARGGNKSKIDYKYSGSNKVNVVAWHESNSGYSTQPVGHKVSNELDLHDMSGNVYEWCWDWKTYFVLIKPIRDNYDPKGNYAGYFRVIRGGSWCGHKFYCEVKDRDYTTPSNSEYDIGFRVSRTC